MNTDISNLCTEDSLDYRKREYTLLGQMLIKLDKSLAIGALHNRSA